LSKFLVFNDSTPEFFKLHFIMTELDMSYGTIITLSLANKDIAVSVHLKREKGSRVRAA